MRGIRGSPFVRWQQFRTFRLYATEMAVEREVVRHFVRCARASKLFGKEFFPGPDPLAPRESARQLPSITIAIDSISLVFAARSLVLFLWRQRTFGEYFQVSNAALVRERRLGLEKDRVLKVTEYIEAMFKCLS